VILEKTSAKNLQRETAAYIIRPYTKDDKSLWLESTPDSEEKDFVKILQMGREQQKNDRAYHLAIVSKGSQKIIGTAMITEIIRDQYQSAFIGMYSNQKQIGDQVVIEAFAATMDIGFNDLDLHRLELLHTIHTKIAKQVLLTLGMRSEGTRKKCFFWDEKWMDAEVFAITKEEWATKHVSTLMNTTYQMR
jgi:RimJ/RimL family protein N-acetyltransferase